MTDDLNTGNLQTTENKREKLFLSAVFLLVIILYVWQLPLNNGYIVRDAAERYVPMAEAFASGNWRYAFHPRLQFLHPLISGCFSYILNVPGTIGTQLSGLLFFGLCVFPIYYILKTVFDRKTAFWGCCCFPLLSQVVLISLLGLRESHKMFAIFLLTLGVLSVYRERKKYAGFLLTGLGCGLAFATRNDILLPGLFLLTVTGTLEFSSCKSLKRSFAALAVVLPWAAAEITINYHLCNYPVPGNRFLPLLLLLPPWAGTPAGFLLSVVPSSLVLYALACVSGGLLLRSAWGKRVLTGLLLLALTAFGIKVYSVASVKGLRTLGLLLESTLNGCNPPLLFFALIGGIRLLRQKKWTTEQVILLALFIFWIMLPGAQILISEHHFYVSERYLRPATPLLLGWGIYGLQSCGAGLKKILPAWGYKPVAVTLALLLAGLCLYHAYSHIYKARFDRRRAARFAAINNIAKVIRENYHGPAFCTPEFNIDHYRSNRRPKIAFLQNCAESPAAFLSGGSICEDPDKADFLVIGDDFLPDSSVWQKIAEDIPSRKATFKIWKRRELK